MHMLMATMSAPSQYTLKGKAKVFNTSDLTALVTTKYDDVMRSQALIKKAEAFTKSLGLEEHPKAVKIIANVGIRACMFDTNKSAPNRPVFKSLTAIGAMFYDEMKAEFGDVVSSQPNPWFVLQLAENEDNKSKDAQPSRGLRGLDVSTTDLANEGFKTDAEVYFKTDTSLRYVVVAMDEPVKLKLLVDNSIVECPRAQLMDRYGIVKEIKEDRCNPNLIITPRRNSKGSEI